MDLFLDFMTGTKQCFDIHISPKATVKNDLATIIRGILTIYIYKLSIKIRKKNTEI